jgi:hypothetical protein
MEIFMYCCSVGFAFWTVLLDRQDSENVTQPNVPVMNNEFRFLGYNAV